MAPPTKAAVSHTARRCTRTVPTWRADSPRPRRTRLLETSFSGTPQMFSNTIAASQREYDVTAAFFPCAVCCFPSCQASRCRCTLTLARKRTLVDARAALPPARRAALSFSRARARALTCMRAEVKETAAASEGIRMSGKGTDVKAESPRARTSCGRRLFQQ